jgi:hypothetical protein
MEKRARERRTEERNEDEPPTKCRALPREEETEEERNRREARETTIAALCVVLLGGYLPRESGIDLDVIVHTIEELMLSPFGTLPPPTKDLIEEATRVVVGV